VSLRHYFFATYFVTVAISTLFLENVVFASLRTVFFILLALLSYSFIYLLPAFLLTLLATKLTTKRLPVFMLAVFSCGATNVMVFADASIYKIFGFHFNGFVWNLLITPGGIESMGGSSASMGIGAAIVVAIFTLQAAILWGTIHIHNILERWIPRRTYPALLSLFMLLTLSERAIYGISEIQGVTPVLMSAQVFPFYKTTRLHSVATALGVDVLKKKKLHLKLEAAQLNYPLQPIKIDTPEKALNIVWLVSESLRGDMLTSEIMPKTWEFAADALRFNHHYSGGNGTRMAMFSLFYGLYGPYWFDFKGLQRSPVLMDTIQQQNYQLFLYTSQSFSYPELNQTIFSNIPRELLHEDNHGFGWERDQQNVTELVDNIRNRDKSRPFMSFMFFESPHARYYFPQQSVIRKPYLEDFNYVTTAIKENIGLIKNRYINSVHHMDSQVGRVLDTLRKENLLQNTLVIITGDHGEEFMEKGRWGHNSQFSEEQLVVPMVLWIPNQPPAVIDRMTSHLDMPATILPLLGVTNPPEDYSLGMSLLGDQERKTTVVADWERVGLISQQRKLYLPLRGTGGFQTMITTSDDQVLPQSESFSPNDSHCLMNLMHELNKFKIK
jgi:hypothetical protein